ncbi:NHL repeat-containing protein [Paenibacillus catalpae]|uniref:NHL repeat-containing protein n=1 Tax=Paenibacillus catalpae TaxID=1045775 RepID=A0A1I1WPJ6_9BACL|nr:stalk domain-containing protein [Paenibacillus catalpae]SFD97056.1 NHL repeat-containing protein [Paenibacillus catalpae]
MYKGKQLGFIALIILLIGNFAGGASFAGIASAADRTAVNGLPLGSTVTLAGGPDRNALAELEDAYRQPSGIVQLKDGSILIADTANHAIRRIADGQSQIFAGASLSNKRDENGLPAGALLDGQAKLAFFNQPAGLAVNAAGDVFVADAGNNAIRKIDKSGNVTTVAGSGVQGFKNGKGEAASFSHPQDVAIAADGTLYVADTLNHVIRRISPQGEVTTIGAASTRAVEPRSGVAVPAGSYKNGSLAEAQFNEPSGLELDEQGNLYVSDSGNQAIRYINFVKGSVTTAAGAEPAYAQGALYADYGFADGAAAAARFHSPRGLAWSKEQGLIIADALNHAIRKLKDGKVTTLAGALNGEGSFSDGIESEARLNTPSDVTVTQSGKLLIADTNNAAIRQWTGYTPPAAWKKGNIAVAYGEKLLASDVAPLVKQGRVMLPVRAVGELLGFTLAQADNGRIQLKKDSRTIYLTPGNRNVVIETTGSAKRTLTADVAPYVLKGHVIAPLRLLAEILGKDVQWAGSDKLVIIRDLKHAAVSGTAAADAKRTDPSSARLMEITALRGESKVSFGGALTVDAYVGMKLGEGAVLETGPKATAQLRTLDKGDEIAVGSGTVLVATELRGTEGILITRLNVVAGHIYPHVADLTHSADRFEVQTGQMTNSVRGTQFMTSVDPLTGQTKLVVVSGKVAVSNGNGNTEQSGPPTYIYPSQQITLDKDEDEPLDLSVNFINVEDLVRMASPDVLAEILRNKAEIDKENEAYLEGLKKQAGSPKDPTIPDWLTQEMLDKLQNNFEQLIGNIAKDALAKNKISKEELIKLIEEANKKPGSDGKKLDLDSVKPLDPSAGLDPRLEAERQSKLKELQEEKKAKLEEEQKRLEQLQAQLGSKLNQLEEQRKKQEEANKRALEELKKKAEEDLLRQLNDKLQEEFRKAQQQAELEKKMQQNGYIVTSASPPVWAPPTTPVFTPPPTSTPEPPATPKVEIHYSDDAATEIRAGHNNYFQSLYFGTEHIDLNTEVQVKVTLEKDGQPVTGIPVKFNESMVESNSEGSFILRKSSDENYKLGELQASEDALINYRSTLKDAGQYTEKTELLNVAGADPVVLGSFTRTLTVTPNATFVFDYGHVEFYQNVEELWKFQSNAYGLAEDAQVGYRITWTGPDNEPVTGQVMRLFIRPHDSEADVDAIVMETNNEGSALLQLSSTGAGTAGKWDLAGGGIDISLTSTLAVEGSYQMTVQLVQLGDNMDIGEPMSWSFLVNPTS